MPLGKIVRVFVSSTFGDLVAERNALQERVFPALRALCESRGARFQAIDLRWGVSDEAGMDQRTMAICLAEVARCVRAGAPRPNFIALLGDRYGWRPAPHEIPDPAWRRIGRAVRTARGEASAALLRESYRRDENAVPPQWLLRARMGDLRDRHAWSEVERELVSALEQAREAVPRALQPTLASATEQEIDAGVFARPDAPRHVHCFFRTIDPLPSAGDRAGMFRDLDPAGRLDDAAAAQLAILKDRLRRRLGSNVHEEYAADWTGRGVTTDHLGPVRTEERASRLGAAGNLCQDVFDALARTIRVAGDRVSPEEEEEKAHSEFGRDRRRCFTGRAGAVAAVEAHLRRRSNVPVAVVGAAGSGKSALLANIAERVRSRHSGAIVVERYAGATARSSTARGLVEGVCREIERAYGAGAGGHPASPDLRALSERLRRALDLASAGRPPLYLFLDGLDQLADDEGARSLSWLPTEWEGRARVAVSAVTASPCDLALRAMLPHRAVRLLHPMPRSEGAAALDAWLREDGRTLQRAQRARVLDAFARNGLPLYLRLAFEEARVWRSFDPVRSLSRDVPGMVRALAARLSAPVNHGPMLVRFALGYLAAARNGLAEDELLEVLAGDDVFFDDFRAHAHHALPRSSGRQLPVAVWSRFQYDLLPYLAERSADDTSLLGFFHRQIGEVVASAFATGAHGRRLHAALVRFFSNEGAVGSQVSARRRLSELPFQLREARMWTGLEKTLCDLRFVEEKCEAGLAFDLVADYAAALAEPGLPARSRRRIADFARFVRAQVHLLATRPALTIQQALNEPFGTAPAEAAQRAARRSHRAYLVGVGRESSRCLATLVGHRDIVNACDVSATGDVIASASSDGTIRLWDAATGKEKRTLLRTGESMESVALSPDGRRVASADRLRNVLVWSLAGDRPPERHPGHRAPVANVTFSPDGRLLASASWDKTVRIWSAERAGRAQRVIRGPAKMYACAFSPDGYWMASGDAAGTLRLDRVHRGARPRKVPAHDDGIWRVAFSPDGAAILTASEDGTVALWDAATLERLRTFRGHSMAVWSAALSPDGRTAVSVSKDRTVRVWNVASGATLAVLRGHEAEVWGVTFFPNGKRVVTAAWDSTLRIWDVADLARASLRRAPAPREEEAAKAVHGVPIAAVSSPDGSRWAAGAWDGSVRVWDARTGAASVLDALPREWVLAAAFSPDGSRIVAGGFAGGLSLVGADRGGLRKLRSHPTEIRSCSFSRDGSRLACCSTSRITAFVLDGDAAHLLRRWDDGAQTFRACAFTPDPDVVAVGDADGKVRMRRISRARPPAPIVSHEKLRSCDVSADGRRLVTCGDDGSVKLWELPSGALLRSLPGHTRRVETARFSPDGERIVTASWDRTVRVWTVERDVPPIVLEGHRDALQDACFTGDGRRVISACMDATFRLWDAATGAELATLLGSPDSVRRLAFTDGGTALLSASHAHDLVVWDARSGRVLRHLEGHAGDVLDVSIAGARAVSASADGTLREWDVRSGRTVRTLAGHRGPVAACVVSADGRVVSGSRDGEVRTWTNGQARLIGRLSDWVHGVSFALDGALVVACSLGGEVCAWDVASGRQAWHGTGRSPALSCVAAPDGRKIAVVRADGTVEIRDARTGVVRRILAADGAVRACAFAPDGGTLAFAGVDRRLRVHDARTGKLRYVAEVGGLVHACAYSPDGDAIATGGEDHMVRVVHASRAETIAEYSAAAPVQAIAWRPDSERLAVGDALGGVQLVDLVRAGRKGRARAARAQRTSAA